MTDGLNLAHLHRDMLKHHLQSKELRYFTDEDGDLLLVFTGGSRDLHVHLGTDDSGVVVWVKVRSTESFASADAPLLLLLLNQRMEDYRWPRLMLSAKGGDSIEILADGHLAVGEALDQAEIDRFLEVTIYSAMSFFDEFNLPDLDAEATDLLRSDEA